MARYGINTQRAFGIPIIELRPIASHLKRNHGPALALSKSGYYEARLLAAFIDEQDQQLN